MRYVAMGICLALGVGGGISVGMEISSVFEDPRWLPYAFGAGVAAVVFAALYLPLLRPIADIANDRLSALNQRVRTTRTGSGLDEVPYTRPATGVVVLSKCRVCGAPGNTVCDACSKKLAPGGPPRSR